ncbi:F-box/kelch-repeat protein At3g06240-like [Neltuma alba]|uniref:F-box/kelch-repeat protein At3g06240-like n=1 Tax=Neltuma alba TaxID=207710 RepID=UPI0010A32753|nr:F-box/kelch-repeat protein At3g06240-like [Prosopis alba]
MDYSLIRLVGSCNGLFIVEMEFIGGPPDDDDDSIYFYHIFLWNPATRDVRQVPEPSTRIHSRNPNYGFGFNPVLNDYKIVRIYTYDFAYAGNRRKIFVDKNCAHDVEVYSLRRGSWEKVESVVLNRVRYLKSFQAVVSNGTMFWLGKMDEEHDLYVVVSFEIATEIFSLMPLPSSSVTPNLGSK